MEAIRITKVVERDGEIRVTGLPFRQGEKIELILLSEAGSTSTKVRPLTSKDLLGSGLVGIWKDRGDVADSVSYARKLRDEAQNRVGGS
jgi:hypothetical protein